MDWMQLAATLLGGGTLWEVLRRLHEWSQAKTAKALASSQVELDREKFRNGELSKIHLEEIKGVYIECRALRGEIDAVRREAADEKAECDEKLDQQAEQLREIREELGGLRREHLGVVVHAERVDDLVKSLKEEPPK